MKRNGNINVQQRTIEIHLRLNVSISRLLLAAKYNVLQKGRQGLKLHEDGEKEEKLPMNRYILSICIGQLVIMFYFV